MEEIIKKLTSLNWNSLSFIYINGFNMLNTSSKILLLNLYGVVLGVISKREIRKSITYSIFSLLLKVLIMMLMVFYIY